MAMVNPGMGGLFWYKKSEDDLIFPPEDDRPNHEGELCLNGYSDDVQGQPDVDGITGQTNLDDTLGEPDLDDIQWQPYLDDIQWQPNWEEEGQDEILDAGKVPVGLAPFQSSFNAEDPTEQSPSILKLNDLPIAKKQASRSKQNVVARISGAAVETLSKDPVTSGPPEIDEQKTKIPGSRKGNKRKASQISKATLEQLSEGDPTSELIIKARKEWGISKHKLAIASGVDPETVKKAEKNISKVSSDLQKKIVYILKNGPDHQLPNRKQEREIQNAQVDRIGFATIIKNIRKKEKLTQDQISEQCNKISKDISTTTIGNIEKSKSNVNISYLAIVAHVLGLKPEDYNLPPVQGIQGVVDHPPEEKPPLKRNKRKASQISEETLEQLSKGDPTSELIIKAQEEWGLSTNQLAKASGVHWRTVERAQTDISSVSTDLKDQIVYILKNGPDHPPPKQKKLDAQVDRIGFATIIKNTRTEKKLNQFQLLQNCQQKWPDIPQNAIVEIEKGNSSVDIFSLAIVAQVLGLNPKNYNLHSIKLKNKVSRH